MVRPGPNPWVEIVLKEGRPNQIKRMFLKVGHRVLRLRRVAVGPVRLTGVRPGKLRPLSPAELTRLQEAVRGDRPRRPRKHLTEPSDPPRIAASRNA